jgi:membrane associated rhomboid family serine protease
VFPLKDNIPTDRFPVVTVALIVANVLIYFGLQQGGWEITSNVEGTWTVEDYATKPCEVTGECPDTGEASTWLTLLTSMFMHGSILHLGGNMLFLWIFGNNVEDSMGRVRFVVFYLIGGLAADAAQIAIDPDSPISTLGASGAVAAVLGGYILMYPRARVLTVIFIVIFFTVIQLPAVLVLGLWFLQQVALGLYDLNQVGDDGGGVAFFAHIGGFVAGLALIRLFAQREKSVPPRYPVY